MNVLEVIWSAVTSAVWFVMAHWLIVLIIVTVAVIAGEAFDRASQVIRDSENDLH